MPHSTSSSRTDQKWRAPLYRKHASFVPTHGRPLIPMLDLAPGMNVLDLGCGYGQLAQDAQNPEHQGCPDIHIIGIDHALSQVHAAHTNALRCAVADARALPFPPRTFHRILSNAVLHWIKEADAVLKAVATALKPGGLFVAEMGGYGNVQRIRSAIWAEMEALGHDPRRHDPWFFPTPDAYSQLLTEQGLIPDSIELFERPTPMHGDMADWLRVFAQPFFAGMTPAQINPFIAAVQDRLAPQLQNLDGSWWIDYVRLRFKAHLRP